MIIGLRCKFKNPTGSSVACCRLSSFSRLPRSCYHNGWKCFYRFPNGFFESPWLNNCGHCSIITLQIDYCKLYLQGTSEWPPLLPGVEGQGEREEKKRGGAPF